MPTLIACLSSGKGTWAEVARIINSRKWDKVFLITNEFGKENFKGDEKTEFVLADNILYKETSDLCNEIKKKLEGKISDFEIALSIISGTGKEHTAVLEAILELGLNFRLITLNKGQVEVMGIKDQ